MEEKEFIDNEIWVENRIEEARQELEELLQEGMKSLNYKETIDNINLELKNLDKQTKQFDYNKDRAIESLEEDFSLKLNDLKTLEENLLDDRIENLEKRSTDYVNFKIESTEKSTDEKINKSINELENKQNDKLNSSVQEINEKLKKVEEENSQKILDLNKEVNSKIDETEKKSIENFKELIEENSNKIEQLKKENEEQFQKAKSEVKTQIESVNKETEDKVEDLHLKLNEKIEELDVEQLKQDYVRFESKIKEVEHKIETTTNPNIDVVLNNIEEERRVLEEEKIKYLREMKTYVESRILRMKYVSTMQAIEEEFSRLRRRIKKLEEEKETKEKIIDSININIEAIVEQKVKEALKGKMVPTTAKQQIRKIETIDDMLYNRGINVNTESTITTAAKQIANITKKRSQILNMDDE